MCNAIKLTVGARGKPRLGVALKVTAQLAGAPEANVQILHVLNRE